MTYSNCSSKVASTPASIFLTVHNIMLRIHSVVILFKVDYPNLSVLNFFDPTEIVKEGSCLSNIFPVSTSS